MKKILSFLLVVAVLFSFSTLCVNAEEAVIYVDAKIEGNVCTVSFTPNFDDKAIAALEVYFVPTNFVPAETVSSVSGGTIAVADYSIFDAAGDGSLYCISAFSMTGSFTGETHTITFDITPSGDAAIEFDMESSYGTDLTDVFMLAKAPVDEKVAIVNSDVTAVVDADYSETSWQKGQGAMIEFKTADLADFVAMNWVLNLTNGATKYAKVNDFSVAGVATENVQFFATFVVNESEATKADYLEIATVGAGFKKAADETVYEAE